MRRFHDGSRDPISHTVTMTRLIAPLLFATLFVACGKPGDDASPAAGGWDNSAVPVTPAEVVEAFLRSAENGEAEMVIGLLSIDTREAFSDEEFTLLFSQKNTSENQLIGVVIHEELILGERALVVVSLVTTLEPEGREPAEIGLVYEDGRWKIDLVGEYGGAEE
jgi:hypothetical protein